MHGLDLINTSVLGALGCDMSVFLRYTRFIEEFDKLQRNYFASTGNHRKDAMLKLIQQITLLLRVSAAPDTLDEYAGGTPVKVMTAVNMAAGWNNETVAIGVRHKAVLDSYARAIKEYLPGRPLFVVTGTDTSFAQRKALRKTLKESKNGTPDDTTSPFLSYRLIEPLFLVCITLSSRRNVRPPHVTSSVVSVYGLTF